MNICLEGPSGRWDWFEANIREDNLGLDFDQIKSVCGTRNPMVIDIEYDKDEPEDILQYDGMGWTSIDSLINQARDLQDYDDWDLERIAIYMRTKDNDIEYAKNNYDNYMYIQTDDADPESLARVLVDEDGVDAQTLNSYFDYAAFGRDLIADGYDTGDDEEDDYTVGEDYINGVYGDVAAYVDAVGIENASQYFDFDGYGRTLNIGWTYDDVSGNWISESISKKTKRNTKLYISEHKWNNKIYRGKTWDDFINDLESNSEYEVDAAYRDSYEQWIELIDKTGNIYDAEVTAYYYAGGYPVYELQDYNIHPSYQYNESLNPKISDTQIRLVISRAANLRDYDELGEVLSSLLSIDKDLYRKYSELFRTSKKSASYIGKEISDELHYLLKDRTNESYKHIKESFSNYDIESYLGQIERKWGFETMDELVGWLMDHSDNANELIDEYGYFDTELAEYWVDDSRIEQVVKNCLETGEVQDW